MAAWRDRAKPPPQARGARLLPQWRQRLRAGSFLLPAAGMPVDTATGRDMDVLSASGLVYAPTQCGAGIDWNATAADTKLAIRVAPPADPWSLEALLVTGSAHAADRDEGVCSFGEETAFPAVVDRSLKFVTSYPQIYIWDGGPQTVTGSGPIGADTLVHLLATCDGSTLRLYVDGVESGTGTAVANAGYTAYSSAVLAAGSLWVGTNSPQSQHNLLFFAYWAGALTAEEAAFRAREPWGVLEVPFATAAEVSAATAVDGTAAVSIAGPILGGAGAASVPAYTGTADVAFPGPLVAGEGSALDPGGVAAVAIAGPAVAASGTSAVPAFTATSAVVLAGPAVAADGTAEPPPITATGALAITGPVASGDGTFDLPPDAGAVSIAGPVVVASGTRTVPSFTGTGAALVAGPTVSGSGGVGIGGAGAIVISRPLISGNGSFTVAPDVAFASTAVRRLAMARTNIGPQAVGRLNSGLS